MDSVVIIALVPVVLLVAYIITVVRQNITEEGHRKLELGGAISGLVIVLVAVMIIGAMTSSVSTYTYSEESQTLYINQNIVGESQPWDAYASDVKSLVIKDGVSIGSGSLDSLTSLEHVKIGEDVTVGSDAFGVSFVGPTGSTVSDLDGYEYAGFGGGTVYQADPSIFSYASGGSAIAGLSSAGAGTLFLVIPRTDGSGTAVETVQQQAFEGNTSIQKALTLPGHTVHLNNHAFHLCTSLTEAHFGDKTTYAAIFYGAGLQKVNVPAAMTSIAGNTFRDCASLTDVEIPAGITEIGSAAFRGCTSLTELALPGGLRTISGSAFWDCTALEGLSVPSSVTLIGGSAFRACTAVTHMSFASGFAATLEEGWAWNLAFYEADGTTAIDKTVAANLAGKTFEGTYTALVEVAA